MYCDFCGRNLAYNVQYCRYCGRHLKGCSGDTQPLPIIDEIILRDAEMKDNKKTPWYQSLFRKKVATRKSKVRRILQYLYSLGIFIGALYIVVTVKTIKEYQIIIGVAGSLWAAYSWWDS